MNKADEHVTRYPMGDGLELEITPSDDSRKVNIYISHLHSPDQGLAFEPTKKQLQRLIRHLKQIENSLKG
jgi:hypothetical protein